MATRARSTKEALLARSLVVIHGGLVRETLSVALEAPLRGHRMAFGRTFSVTFAAFKMPAAAAPSTRRAKETLFLGPFVMSHGRLVDESFTFTFKAPLKTSSAAAAAGATGTKEAFFKGPLVVLHGRFVAKALPGAFKTSSWLLALAFALARVVVMVSLAVSLAALWAHEQHWKFTHHLQLS